MKTKFQTLRRLFLAPTMAALAIVLAGSTSEAKAQYSRYFGHGQNHHGHNHHGHGHRSGPIYHAPSVHYHRVYHPEYLHWTPGRGLHTHGHYDLVPHYTPGHFDYQHGNHIHFNRRFH